MAGLAASMCSVMVISLRTGKEAAAFLPQVDETQGAAQAAVLSASDTFSAAGVTLLTRLGASVAIVTVGQIARKF